MRLTLLTLLAYLDDNLDPGDARELEKKIEESKFASDLVHRIRTCTRRLRLDAPKLDGKGMGLDPNTVAEFLDSTLPRDRFPDFEKVCLESDRHLAEVASCHQILTLVVDQPAQVPVGLRERVYRVGSLDHDTDHDHRETAARSASKGHDVAEPVPPPKSAAVRHTAIPEPPPAPTAQPRSSIPDYLQEEVRSWWPLALAFGMAFLVVGGGWYLIGPGGNPITWLLNQGKQVAQNDRPETNQSSGDSQQSSTADNTDVGTRDTTQQGGPDLGANMDDEPLGTNEDDGNTNPAETIVPDEPPPPVNENSNEAVASDNPANTEPPPETVVVEPAAKVDAEVARLLSEDQILSHFNATSKVWQRFPRGATILSETRLVVLPTYRPILSLSNGVQLMMDGDSAFKIRATEKAGLPIVELEYGHAVFSTAGKAGQRVQLEIGEHSGIATFSAIDSELAVEVQKVIPPGGDAPVTIVRSTATMGTVEWEATNGESSSINKNQMLVAISGMAAETVDVEGPPGWLTRKNVSTLDRRASRDLEGFLNSDKALTLLLEERTNFRQVEVRSLAARCLGSMDEFGALLRELNDDKQRSYWHTAVEALREALARGPESARKLKLAVQVDHGENAKAILRILQDYDQEQFEQGGAKQLIEFLDHDTLTVRVLAFETLRRITGSTHNYNPERPADERRKSIAIWNQRLKEKAIPYKAAATILPEKT